MIKKKVLVSVTIVLCFGIFLVFPQEWKIIYPNIVSKSQASLITKPVNFLANDLKDTYGALRSEERSHEGTDIFVPYGTAVQNVIDGMILYTGRDTYGGNVVKIMGKDNRIYYYAHLASYLEFNPGQKVQAGKRIGYVGKTGNALNTPAHLHFEIMEIDWYLPLIMENINPYPELAGISKRQ